MKTASKEITAMSLVKAALEKAHQHQDEYHIFTFLNDANAIKKAAEIDEKIKNVQPLRMARVLKIAILALPKIPKISRGSQVDRAAVRPWRWRLTSWNLRPALTLVARFVNRPALTVFMASNRLMARSVVMAWWPWLLAPTA